MASRVVTSRIPRSSRRSRSASTLCATFAEQWTTRSTTARSRTNPRTSASSGASRRLAWRTTPSCYSPAGSTRWAPSRIPRGTSYRVPRLPARSGCSPRLPTRRRCRAAAALARSLATSRTRLASSRITCRAVSKVHCACARWLNARDAPPRITAVSSPTSSTGELRRLAGRWVWTGTPWRFSRRVRFARPWCSSPPSSRRTYCARRGPPRARLAGIASSPARLSARGSCRCPGSTPRIPPSDPSPPTPPRCSSCSPRTATRRCPRADRAWRVSYSATRCPTSRTSRSERARRACPSWRLRIQSWCNTRSR
mmetsp:Transcript_10962/g.50625  ORF Transcript_10962/g.50625 Transcript_10962/m.50625 type:complete len:311 (-) Transcript_10962:2200-3132(-)